MNIFVVTAYRWGLRDNHSYVVGAASTLKKAKELAQSHTDNRGGKYGCEVCECELDRPDDCTSCPQVYYKESPYYDCCGRSAPACHPADKKKHRDALLRQEANES